MMSGNNRTAGNAASWAVGATLGVVLGLGLLIAGPRLIPGAANANVTETTPAGKTAETPSEAAPTPTTETLEGSATTNETANSSTSETAGEQTAQSGADATTDGEAGAEGGAAQGDSEASAQTQGDEATTAEGDGSTVQEDTASSATPGTEVQASAEAGQTVYASNCAACHGQNGGGAIGPALNSAATWNLAEFTGSLREGKTPTRTLNATMPRFSEAQINNQQLADLHAYVQTLQ